VYDKKLVLPIPEHWKTEFRTGITTESSILITPPEGTGFQMFISPYYGFEGSVVSHSKIRTTLEKRMSRWDERAREKPSLKEQVTGDCALSYYEIDDRYAYEDDPKATVHKSGFAVINGTAYYFTLRFKENGAGAQKAMDSLSRARVFDLHAVYLSVSRKRSRLARAFADKGGGKIHRTNE
jgi:hypothetical protein